MTQQRAREEALGGFAGDVAGLADDDALARGQAVGFDHNGRMKDLDSLFDFGRREQTA